MPRGKRAESNGHDAAQALKASKENGDHVESEAVEQQAEAEAPGPGHNQPAPLTPDERFVHLSRYKKNLVLLRRAKKEAADAVKDAEKICKAELGPEAVLEIDNMIELETAEGEAKFKAKVEREVRVAQWMGLPVGANGNLFDLVDRTPAVDRAAARGKRDGLAGERAEPKCDPSTPQYQAYMTGYHEGQTIAFNIKPLETEHAPEAPDDDTELDALDPAHSEEPPAPEASSPAVQH